MNFCFCNISATVHGNNSGHVVCRAKDKTNIKMYEQNVIKAFAAMGIKTYL